MQSPTIINLLQHFKTLPGQIASIQPPDEFSVEKFKTEWKQIFNSPLAHENKDIVYIWTTKKSIPRLRGESNIIYIGKTINSFHQRHFQYAHIEATGKRNNPRYRHILANFGDISFHVASYVEFGKSVKEAEQRLLQAYFDDHLEYPPLNRMGR